MDTIPLDPSLSPREAEAHRQVMASGSPDALLAFARTHSSGGDLKALGRALARTDDFGIMVRFMEAYPRHVHLELVEALTAGGGSFYCLLAAQAATSPAFVKLLEVPVAAGSQSDLAYYFALRVPGALLHPLVACMFREASRQDPQGPWGEHAVLERVHELSMAFPEELSQETVAALSLGVTL